MAFLCYVFYEQLYFVNITTTYTREPFIHFLLHIIVEATVTYSSKMSKHHLNHKCNLL